MTKEEFKQMRIDAGATQNALAKTLRIHPMTISKIERGILKPFNLRLRLEEIMLNGNFALSMLVQIDEKKGR